MTKDHFREEKKKGRKERKEASKRDRSKFKKTDAGKREEILKTRAKAKLEKKEELSVGRVLQLTPDWTIVEVEEKELLCTIRGTMKQEVTRKKNLVVVGDIVRVEKIDEEHGVIAFVENRNSILSRRSHFHKQKEQIVAANIDQVLIVASIFDPPLSPDILDRSIIAAQKGNITPIIVINKLDLLKKGTAEYQLYEECKKIYKSLSLKVIALSAETGKGIDELKKVMKGKASIFSGQSGVGKSSLINIICNIDLPTADISHKLRRGVHTTTGAQLIPLPIGGFCVDTPGFSSFGVYDLKREDLDAYFPEIFDTSSGCKFVNCSHTHEPGCAVKVAVEAGEIAGMRFESYRNLLEEVK